MAISKLERHEQELQQFRVGNIAGRMWAEAAHPADILTLIKNVGWSPLAFRGESWNTCPFPDLKAQLRAKGSFFTVGFFNGVGDEFQAKHHALISIRHNEGESDGQRWATEFASQELIERLGDFAAAWDQRKFFVNPSSYEPAWTPAHELVAWLVGDHYPSDEGGELAEDCPEFRSFWEPFVTEPIGRVMAKLKLDSLRGRHKLQDPYYVTGFIDGALGLSDQIRQRLSESAAARPSLISDAIDA